MRPGSPYTDSMSMTMPIQRKSGSFTHTLPDVHIIPADAASWAENERASEPTQYESDHVNDLARDSLAYATALAEEETVGSEVLFVEPPETTRFSFSYDQDQRLSTPPRLVLEYHVPDYETFMEMSSQLHRKPVPMRAQTAHEDSPQREDTAGEYGSRPRLDRGATTHQPVKPKKRHDKGESMSERRVSLHPFECLATVAFKKTKKGLVKAAAALEEKNKRAEGKALIAFVFNLASWY